MAENEEHEKGDAVVTNAKGQDRRKPHGLWQPGGDRAERSRRHLLGSGNQPAIIVQLSEVRASATGVWNKIQGVIHVRCYLMGWVCDGFDGLPGRGRE